MDLRTIGAGAVLLACIATTGYVNELDARDAERHAATATVQEGDPGWNCYTMGNHRCGVDAYSTTPDGMRGAILPKASDGIVYVAWEDGVVSAATHWERKAAWETCVDYATGTDASLFTCDANFQLPGDTFAWDRVQA